MLKNKYCLIFIVLVAVIINGCNASNKKAIVVYSDMTINHFPQQVFFNPVQLSDVNVALMGIGYDGNQVASAMYSANMNAALQPGYTPAAGLAGSLIAGSLLRNMQQNAAIEERNEPILLFLSTVEAIDWGKVINSADVDFQLFAFKSDHNHESRLVVTPILNLSPDYRSLILMSFVEMRNSSGKVIYQNYIHIHSAPILSWNETITNLNSISHQDISERLSVMLSQLDSLMYKELEGWQNMPSKLGGDPIKFIHDLKEYYERGTLLEKENNFITYRTLRGEIKHIPCEKII